jgi:hypothetical protein
MVPDFIQCPIANEVSYQTGVQSHTFTELNNVLGFRLDQANVMGDEIPE